MSVVEHRRDNLIEVDFGKISKTLNKNLDEIKDLLKKADTQRKGYLAEEIISAILKRFAINIGSLEKFKKGGNS